MKTKISERELLNKKWGEFKVKDIFNINTWWDLIINKVKQWNIPVISHTALNNWVALYSDEISWRKKFSCKNTISLADRWNFKAFVQNQDFYVWTRVKALESKRNDIEQLALLFLSRVIDNQSIKFSYGHNACDNLWDLKIMLPITENEEIDYKFMENYMKYLMLGKYQKYLDYLKEKTLC